MRRISKIASALALSAALALGVAAPALADVVYEDRELAVYGSGSYTATDLFGNFKNVMPGDGLEQSVEVSNAGSKSVKVYLRAEAHDEAGNPLTYSEAYEDADGKDQAHIAGQRDETVATMADFLSQLHMTVSCGGETVFDASPDLEAQLSEGVLLGEVAAGDALRLYAHLDVPLSMDDSYANRVGEVDWVFTVEEIDDPASSGGSLSQTGDSSPLLLLAAAAGAAAVVALVAFAAMRRRGRR